MLIDEHEIRARSRPVTHLLQKVIMKSIYRRVSVRKLAKRLNCEYEKSVRGWRDVAQNYPGVNFATLHRIAHSNGAWIPRNEHIRELLGLTKKPRVKPPTPHLGEPGWERRFFKKIGTENQGNLLESVSTLFERLRKG